MNQKIRQIIFFDGKEMGKNRSVGWSTDKRESEGRE